MFDSIYFPSGNPSLKMIQELLSLLPGAVIISDLETGTALAMSPTAERLLSSNQDEAQLGVNFGGDRKTWAEGVAKAIQAEGEPVHCTGWMVDNLGQRKHVLANLTVKRMAGRQVLISALEKGCHCKKRHECPVGQEEKSRLCAMYTPI